MKHIITSQQIADIKATLRWLCHGEVPPEGRRVITSANVLNMLDSLKPIEPMTDDAIEQAVLEVCDAIYALDDTPYTEEDVVFYGAFVNAIERHILEETP